MEHSGVVIVHVGAGYHSPSKAVDYRKACADALVIAVALLRAGGDAADVAMETVVSLESAACTNTGRGSNLAVDGCVHCDAGLMVDHGSGGRFAAVGAVPHQPHPIRLAHHMLHVQRTGLSLGRVNAQLDNVVTFHLLVGQSANEWAVEHGLTAAAPAKPLTTDNNSADPLVTPQSLERFHRGTQQLQQAEQLVANLRHQLGSASPPSPSPAPPLKRARQNEDEDVERFDTVGAVVIDCAGRVASAVSSGGIMLKHPGRVGQAAVFGSGCWADAAVTTGNCGVGSCTSGLGEQLVMTCLARRVAAEVSRAEHSIQGVQRAVKLGFLGSSYVEREAERLAGVIVARHEPRLNTVELTWSHCSSSFVIGYHSTEHRTPQTLCSRLPPEGVAGCTVLSQGVTLPLHPCSLHVQHHLSSSSPLPPQAPLTDSEDNNTTETWCLNSIGDLTSTSRADTTS